MTNDLPFSTTWPGTLQSAIPSYVYLEYNDDDDLQALFAANNALMQQYITLFNTISLPIYTGPLIIGQLLDWVGVGLYGVGRPTLATGTVREIGAYGTYQFGVLGFGYGREISSQSYFVATDDIYKRVLTWQHYKGDGFNFNITWLKRRVMRFINGRNGTDPLSTNDLRNIGVTVQNSAFTIRIFHSASYSGAAAFAACIQSGILNLPFQFTYTVILL